MSSHPFLLPLLGMLLDKLQTSFKRDGRHRSVPNPAGFPGQIKLLDKTLELSEPVKQAIHGRPRYQSRSARLVSHRQDCHRAVVIEFQGTHRKHIDADRGFALEDVVSSKQWPEDLSPYQAVAAITVAAQENYSDARQVFVDEQLLFSPEMPWWRTSRWAGSCGPGATHMKPLNSSGRRAIFGRMWNQSPSRNCQPKSLNLGLPVSAFCPFREPDSAEHHQQNGG